MKTVLGILAATFLFAAPVRAADYSGFYDWYDQVFVQSDLLSAWRNDARIMVIRVENAWGDHAVPQAYRHWLPIYHACTAYAEEIENAHKDGVTGFEVVVVLNARGATMHDPTFAWVPTDVARCEETLSTIRQQVTGQ